MPDLPTDIWHLWSRGDLGFRLEVSWPNGLATPIIVDGQSLDEVCTEARRQWDAGMKQ
jgi:hypothetical protein